MEYDINFDKSHSNNIIIKKEGKHVTMIACPPIDYGCDIINFSDKINDGYTYNFKGLLVITTPSDRKIYHEGKLIAETIRNEIIS